MCGECDKKVDHIVCMIWLFEVEKKGLTNALNPLSYELLHYTMLSPKVLEVFSFKIAPIEIKVVCAKLGFLLVLLTVKSYT